MNASLTYPNILGSTQRPKLSEFLDKHAKLAPENSMNFIMNDMLSLLDEESCTNTQCLSTNTLVVQAKMLR